MKILIEYPPIIDKIDEAFKCRDDQVIYAWGDTIYNPHGIQIPQFLIEHEKAHGRRQAEGIEAWWDKYIEDVEFRYNEELIAHATEHKFRLRGVKDRNEQSRILMQSASRLVSPLYGKMTNLNQAMKDIKAIYAQQPL